MYTIVCKCLTAITRTVEKVHRPYTSLNQNAEQNKDYILDQKTQFLITAETIKQWLEVIDCVSNVRLTDVPGVMSWQNQFPWISGISETQFYCFRWL